MKPRIASGTILVAVSLTVITAIFAQTDRDNDRPGVRTPHIESPRRAAQEDVRKKRIREGTVFKEKRCVFRIVGTRPTLFSEDERERFSCLENLNLERVMQVVRESPTVPIWSVDGMFTEYLDENYVLIQRAVLAPALPAQSDRETPRSNETRPGNTPSTAETAAGSRPRTLPNPDAPPSPRPARAAPPAR